MYSTKVIKTVNKMQKVADELRRNGRSIGFVPTMGYLHEGHLSLVRCARSENDVTVVSIYVNPTQFGPTEDYKEYPRDVERDLKLLENEGVDFAFIPSDEEMYPEEVLTNVHVRKLTDGLCGARRPGHFDGVCLVVSKLFNIVKPHKAYFGKKDYQQYRVIERMVKDLNFDIQVVPCPIVREKDGLAMSSRNIYLSPKERRDATSLYRSLLLAQELIKNGERDVEVIKKKMEEFLKKVESIRKIDYIEIVDKYTLQPAIEISGRELIAIAVYVGKARLIDNLEVEL